MKYTLSFKLTNPQNGESVRIKGIAEITEYGGFTYGNGKAMTIKYTEGSVENHYYDIRYDKRYRSNDERGYLKEVIKDMYSGDNGSWKSSYINIKTKFEL